MAESKALERLAAAMERIADAVAELVAMQRVDAPPGSMTVAATAVEAPQGEGHIGAAASLGALADPVARLAEAVTTIAATNAQLAAERRAMRKLREEEMAAVLEDVGRGRAMGTP